MGTWKWEPLKAPVSCLHLIEFTLRLFEWIIKWDCRRIEYTNSKYTILACGLIWVEDSQDSVGPEIPLPFLNYLKEFKILFPHPTLRTRAITRDIVYLSNSSVWQGTHLIIRHISYSPVNSLPLLKALSPLSHPLAQDIIYSSFYLSLILIYVGSLTLSCMWIPVYTKSNLIFSC